MPEHELDAPRRSEMKFDALSGEPTNSSRGRYPASGPRLQTAPKTGSRSRVATPSGAALQPRFRRNPGPAPWLTSGISPRPAVGVSASHKGAIKLAAGHSRKRECRSRLLRRAPRADGLPECEPPPTVRSAPITVAMPGRIFLETPAMGAQSIFSVSAKHVYWTVRQLGRPAAGYLQASVRFRTVQTTFSLVKVSLWT